MNKLSLSGIMELARLVNVDTNQTLLNVLESIAAAVTVNRATMDPDSDSEHDSKQDSDSEQDSEQVSDNSRYMSRAELQMRYYRSQIDPAFDSSTITINPKFKQQELAMHKLPRNTIHQIIEYTGDIEKEPYIEIIAEAIDSMPPLTEQIIVYRGQDIASIHSEEWFSVSLDQSTALNFTRTAEKCCLFIITLIQPMRVLPVYYVKKDKAEMELIVPGGGVFNVTRLDTSVEIKTIHCEYKFI